MRKLVTLILTVMILAVMLTAVWACEPTPEAPTPEAPTPEAPPEAIELRFSTADVEAHWRVGMMEWFAQELKERTGGRVETTIYSGGTLGGHSDIADLIMNGTTHMGFVLPIRAAGYFPTVEITGIPLFISSPLAVEYIVWEIYNRGYLEIEGAKLLGAGGFEPTRLILRGKKVTTVEDFQGLRIHSAGGWEDLAGVWGFSPETVAMPEIYSAFERNMLDGLYAGAGLPMALNMQDVVDYICWNNWQETVDLLLINQAKWDSLPSDVQVVMLELCREMNSLWTGHTFTADVEAYEFFENAGVEIYTMSPEEWARVEEQSAMLVDKWAADMDAKGIPGTEVKEIVLETLYRIRY